MWREDAITSRRPIDFVFEVGGVGIGVENKPWAADSPDQVADCIAQLEEEYAAPRRWVMLYLAGDGQHPSTKSLAEARRKDLEQKQQFFKVPYRGPTGVVGWLERCREKCKAPKVNHFLDGLIAHLEQRLQGKGATRVAAVVTAAFDGVALKRRQHMSSGEEAGNVEACAIIKNFAEALRGRLTEELARLGPGWRVREAVQEYAAVSHQSWPREKLRVALWSDVLPSSPYFIVTEVDEPSKSTRPPDHFSLRVVEELTKVCGRTNLDPHYYPYWYQNCDDRRDWLKRPVLLRLHRERRFFVEDFMRKLIRMATAVDKAVNEHRPSTDRR